MYLISEEYGVVINAQHVFQYHVDYDSCKDCDDYLTCTEVKPDGWHVECIPLGGRSSFKIGTYSTEKHAYDALCQALAEMESTDEPYVKLMTEDQIKKFEEIQEKRKKQKEENKRNLYDVKLDPAAWGWRP